jgi:uncharacterized membrane protein
MYQVLFNYLSNGSYTRDDAEWRIARLVASGYINEVEEQALQMVAEVHAKKDDVPTIEERVAALEAAVFGDAVVAAEETEDAEKLPFTEVQGDDREE